MLQAIFTKHKQEHHRSDTAAIESLADILEREKKVFVFVNKYGVHFPYISSYPEKQKFFKPTLRRGEPMNDRPKALNTYKNGIRWAVDTWFKTFFAKKMSLRNYLIIYTSDHGQNIMDNGTLCTHCCPGSGASRFEGIVPMIVFSDHEDFLKPFQDIKQEVYNRTSHFQMFPTMLIAMGFERDWVYRRYGPSLLHLPHQSPQFFIGDIHGRGSEGRWVSIER